MKQEKSETHERVKTCVVISVLVLGSASDARALALPVLSRALTVPPVLSMPSLHMQRLELKRKSMSSASASQASTSKPQKRPFSEAS